MKTRLSRPARVGRIFEANQVAWDVAPGRDSRSSHAVVSAFAGMVLSAGYGSRLAPLTQEIPKPLVPIGPRPLLVTILEKLREGGARQLVVNSHHMGVEIVNVIKNLEYKVHVSHEQKILGTAGGVARARALFSALPVVVVNGDIYGQLPLTTLLAGAGPGWTIALVRRPLGEGTVGVNRKGQVVRLREGRFGEEVSSGDFMGVSVVSPGSQATLPQEGCLVGDWALPHLRAGGTIDTVWVESTFIDIGSPRKYLEANYDWLEGLPSATPGLEVGSGVERSYVAESARVLPTVNLRGSVVGAGARIGGAGEVVDSVVLPGAGCVAPLRDAIVLPSGKVMTVRRE